MSSQFLQTELSNLIQESKRKNSDLRNAAEQSLNELRALPSTSESQISADLVRKPKFADPFIIACHSRYARLAGISVICLQRLVASRSLPPERLKDVLGGLWETTNLSQDVQLKILQSLPSLMQHYSDDLTGELLSSTLEICATLQASKNAAVSSTAAATLQQLVVSAFERVFIEDKMSDGPRAMTTVDIDGSQLTIGCHAHDAFMVLDDLCSLIDGEQLRFLQIKTLSPTLVLELIESVLVNSARLFSSHPELAQVLRTRLVPLTIRYFSERHAFPQTVRMARILLLLLKRHMSLLTAECEMALSLLTHLLEPDGTEFWKRVLCMEVFRGLYAEPGLIRLVYSLYDATEGRKDILKDHMASLVRLASEKPSLIGVSNQSTAPSRAEHSRSTTEEQITLETGGVAGMIGTTGPSLEMDVPGISSEWSVVRTPYIELLDKADPPPPPETYIYSIILNCIAAFSEGLAKFILPLTVPELKQKRRNRTGSDSQELQRSNFPKTDDKKSPIPINPLDLKGHAQISSIKACAGIIDDCWPAILATCSTFLYASLDDEFYHSLVRSFQKLTHVAGLLRLSVPRDAFLTTLGKAGMPMDTGGVKPTGLTPTTGAESLRRNATEKKWQGTEMLPSRSQLSIETSNTHLESPSVTLSTRNLLCLRALLNLGIALGPTLDQQAWSIILETLRDADLMIGMSSVMTAKSTATASSPVDAVSTSGIDVPKAHLGTEIIAVQAASTKMFESTSDYPSSSFQDILVALLSLSGNTEEVLRTLEPSPSSPSSPSSLLHSDQLRQDAHRVSLTIGRSRMQEEELKFVLERIEELARANLCRLSSLHESERSTWRFLTDSLVLSAANNEISPGLRLKASSVLNDIIFRTMGQNNNENAEVRNEVQLRNLRTLQSQIRSLYDTNTGLPKTPAATVFEIHERGLEVLKNILEQYAETFVDAWGLIFSLISSIFRISSLDEDIGASNPKNGIKTPLPASSPRLVHAAYKSLQLVASDFLTLLPSPCLLTLVNSFSEFASQYQDFNISLTTTSFFWNVSDFLERQIELFSIESRVDASVNEEELVRLVKEGDVSASRNALWLILLLRIVDITTDSRAEIRNSAIRTLLRIFDAYGQQLSPKAWHLCLNGVLFRMVEEVEAKLVESTGSKMNPNSDEVKSWIDTTVVMVKGCSDLITSFFETIIQDEEFDQSWKRLLGYLRRLIDFHLLEFNEATFSSLSGMLLRAEAPHSLSDEALQAAWTLWADGHPALNKDSLDLGSPNQDAALAYLQTFQQIYHLYKDHLTEERIETILQHMQFLVWNSISPRYSPDTDRPSALQTLVVDCTKMICMEKDASQPQILLCLASYADSALSKWTPDSDTRKPTFVAFSKNAIDLLDWYIADFGIKQDIFTNGSLTTVLEHLSKPISQKYEWSGKDREPYLWQKATTASLDILQVAIPYVKKQYGKCTQSEIARFWRCVVDISQGIVSARGYRISELPISTIHSDESFDTAAFHRLKSLIIPALGAYPIPDSVRRDFATAIFHSSFIYPPRRSDLPGGLSIEEPLRDLCRIRPGRTFDPPPTFRPSMAYALIDTMFDLASVSHVQHEDTYGSTDDNPAITNPHILLARSVTPYLILRCAVSLKAYIADQPLRGLMPQPTPARKALLHLLTGMVELRSEPSAIPELSETGTGTGIVEDIPHYHHKKHLERLYPLIVRAVQVAGREDRKSVV